MYSNFLFLLLVFLIPSFFQGLEDNLIPSSEIAFILGVSLYFVTLIFIIFQNYYVKELIQIKNKQMLWIVNVELISFLFIYFFILNANRLIFEYLPFQLISYLATIAYYLLGLYLFHFTSSLNSRNLRSKNAFKEITFLAPFTLPFLFFSFVGELLSGSSFDVFLNDATPFIANLTMIFLSLSLICLTLIFFPYFIQMIWQCKPLKDEEPLLTEQLELLCKKASFKHAGIKIWTVMNDSLTAAIIGLLPKFRYVMFTKKLIKTVSETAILAILAHEIGHGFRKHLLIYQFIILGLFFSLILLESILGGLLPSFIFFVLYVSTVLLYFRFVFGFFSRMFERQADLHVYELDLDPKFMIEALDQVAKASGNIHSIPCWHHYSIHDRIDFLNKTIENPSLIKKHHAFVKKACVLYFITLIVLFLVVLNGS